MWTFPAPFIELPVVIPGASSHSVSSDLWGQRIVTTSYNSSLVPEGAERQIHWTVRDTRSSGSAGGLRVHMLAVGKWK